MTNFTSFVDITFGCIRLAASPCATRRVRLAANQFLYVV